MKTYSESDIKAAIVDMMKANDDNARYCSTSYDRGYCDGVHDGLMDVLMHFHIENDLDYYND